MMQKLGTLLTTIMLSCNVFSQTVIQDSSYVILRSDTARMVAIELVEKDMLTAQAEILRDSIGILKEINEDQSSIIINYEQQKDLYSLKCQDYEKKLQEDLLLQERLNQQIKVNRAWAIGLGSTAAVAIASTILVLILGGK